MAELISVEEAWSRLAEHAPALRAERVRLMDAPGRILAEDIAARVTQPPFAASAMDGYAVRFADAQVDARLRVIGEAPAGAAFDGEVGPGEAVRIFTGGVVPQGADHVIVQEDVIRVSDSIVVKDRQEAPANIRAPGVDFREGDIVLRAGDVLSGARLALAAAANVAELSVARRPVVAILASGDELAEPGSDLKPGQIVGSTSFGLAALIREWGGEPLPLGTAADTIEAVHAKLDDAKDADLIAPLGGASVGDRDVMREAFARRGFKLYFEKIAVRPGKPTWFGQHEEQRVLGLPGNPASALVCAHLFVKPLLWAATGRAMADATRTTPARLAETAPRNGPRETWLRARAEVAADGVLSVTHFPRQDSSLLTPFAASNCLLRLAPGAAPATAGAPCEILLLNNPF
jgi:molybdopterin molybdotransferase